MNAASRSLPDKVEFKVLPNSKVVHRILSTFIFNIFKLLSCDTATTVSAKCLCKDFEENVVKCNTLTSSARVYGSLSKI